MRVIEEMEPVFEGPLDNRLFVDKIEDLEVLRKETFAYPFMEVVVKGTGKKYRLNEDKSKWFLTIDEKLDKESENPVQNKVIAVELDKVFQSVSNGKTMIAEAITDKGVPTSASDTFLTMAGNIGNIKTGSAIQAGIKTNEIGNKYGSIGVGGVTVYV